MAYATGGLDLTTGDPLRFEGLYAERTEGQLVATLRIAFHAALLRAAKFGFLGL